MPLKRVAIGRVIFEGDTDGVMLPYEFLEKLENLLESIPADEFDGCLDDAQADI